LKQTRNRILVLFSLLFSCFSAFADFGIGASAISLQINGTSGFYNAQKSTTLGSIGSNSFGGHLGVFGYKSGTFIISGAEVRTYKDAGSSVCGGNMFYTIYPQGIRPLSPVFTAISLSLFCNCNGTTFSSCGGGICNSIYDQKIQNISKSIDLTELDAGDYTLEVYYEVSGAEGIPGNCLQHHLDNANGLNYKADFTISAPLAVSFSGFNGVVGTDAIKVHWTIQNESDILKYEIEKSPNGLSFSTIGTISAGGASSAIQYSFNDDNPIVGTNYYRIKIYHLNTAVSLSSIIRVYFEKVGNTLLIFPNPTGTQLTIRFAAVNKGNYQLSVIGTNGQQILKMPVRHDGTDKTIKVEMPVTLSKGIYRLFMINQNLFFKQTFLIK
jgi:hypothetical protein